jgi:hypothetical protein
MRHELKRQDASYELLKHPPVLSLIAT